MSVLFLMPEKSKEEWKMPKKKEMCSSVSIEPDKGIVMMSISELHDFKGHPFKVERNPELFELRQSIEKEGILIPLLIRKNTQ